VNLEIRIIVRGLAVRKRKIVPPQVEEAAMWDLAKELGKKIKGARKLRGISQESLALMCRVDRSYMGRIERGEVNLTLEKLYQIAQSLDCEPSALLPSPPKSK
jgi:ribosome-binding protein aMBF1 (putative translation factor)